MTSEGGQFLTARKGENNSVWMDAPGSPSHLGLLCCHSLQDTVLTETTAGPEPGKAHRTARKTANGSKHIISEKKQEEPGSCAYKGRRPTCVHCWGPAWGQGLWLQFAGAVCWSCSNSDSGTFYQTPVTGPVMWDHWAMGLYGYNWNQLK